MTQRLNLEMTTVQLITKMSDGNPGAITACVEILNNTERIDPDSFAGGLLVLFHLDAQGIYGSRLYMLWNDVCKRDIAQLLSISRAHQLGQLAGVTSEAWNHAIDNRGEGLDLTAIMAAVQQELPNFNKLDEAVL
jgi:hypothetical protein